ncbi:MAG TPA: hypothetical protein VHK88_10740, partial [Aquihabitans sp.]|nr:hypothetical protein [Aquihabitans sp.]
LDAGPAPRPDAAAGQAAGAPSDNDTLVAVLAAMRADGYDADLRPRGDAGEVVCSACGTVTPAGGLEEREERRLEGASDPADMVLVVGARCPACQARGALVLGYGPDASAEDSAVVSQLR